jgi:hypothetical protein
MVSMFARSTSNPDRHRRDAWSSEITLRLATEDDAPALARLAQLESRRPVADPHLVAARDGVVEAALNLSNGELIADPFRRTAELCHLLRCHAGPARLRQRQIPTPDPCLSPALAPA